MPTQILGPDGLPIRKAQLTREVAAPALSTVRQVQAGHPSIGLTPRRLASILRSAEDGDHTAYVELAADMEEKDLHYAAVMGTRRRQVAQLEISLEGGEPSAAELVQEWIDRDELQHELIDVLAGISTGWSVTELIWETTGGRWWPAGLEWRDPRWFRPDRIDGKTVRLIGDGGQDEDLPRWKFLVYQPKVSAGLPIRSGLARAAAWAYMFKNYTVKDWAIFLEVYGQPIRVGKFHAGATAEERETLLRAVASIGTDAAAIIPEGMSIEFVRSDTTSTDAYEANARFWDQQISKLVLGQTTTTEAISGGHAVSKEHNEVREDIERADARQLAAALTRQIVRPLVSFNLGPQVEPPKLLLGRAEEADVDRTLRAVQALVPMGLQVAQRQMRSMFGIDEPEGDEPLLVPRGGQPADPAERARGRRPGDQELEDRAAQAAQAAADDDDIDRLVDLVLGETSDASDALVAAIRRTADEAPDLAALRDRLLPLLASGMSPDDLAAALGPGLVTAELLGRDAP